VESIIFGLEQRSSLTFFVHFLFSPG